VQYLVPPSTVRITPSSTASLPPTLLPTHYFESPKNPTPNSQHSYKKVLINQRRRGEQAAYLSNSMSKIKRHIDGIGNFIITKIEVYLKAAAVK